MKQPPTRDAAGCEYTNWSRGEKLVVGLSALALLTSLGFLTHPWYDPKPDAAVYIASARSLADGDGYVYLGQPISVRPPGFAILIASLVGEGTIDFRRLNVLVSLFGVASVLLLFVHQRTRVPWPLALLTGLAIWLNPGFQRLCNQTMSDVPALALLLACLLLERWAARATTTGREGLLGLAIGLSGYVRTGNLVLVPAIALARALRSVGSGDPWARFLSRRVAVFALSALIVQVPWTIRNELNPSPIPADQNLPYSYAVGLLRADKADPGSQRLSPGEIVARVPGQLEGIAAGLGTRLQSEQSNRWTDAFAALLMLGFLITLMRRRGPAELFTAGTLAIVAGYFGYQNRLILPVYVLAFAFTVEAVHLGLRRLGGMRIASAATAMLLLLVVAWDLPPPRGWDSLENQHRRLSRLAAALTDELPPDACLASAWGYHYGLFMQRPVYSLQPSLRRGGLPELERTLDRYGVDRVILSERHPSDAQLLPYFENRYGPSSRVRKIRVFQVRSPSERCGEGHNG